MAFACMTSTGWAYADESELLLRQQVEDLQNTVRELQIGRAHV